MYANHFGLDRAPFALTPDTEFFFSGPGHQGALNVLLVALGEGEGFVKVTGEVGLGKTLLCRLLLSRLREPVATAFIPNPALSPTALHRALAAELGVPEPPRVTSDQRLVLLERRLLELAAQRRRVVVCIDEAQALPHRSLEAVRLLSNLETEKRKLLQIVLFGQPELDARLALREFRQLNQRISFAYRLTPLSRQQTVAYLRHRLARAGHRGPLVFTNPALRSLYRGSGGVPRLINILAHKGLLAAYGEGTRQVHWRHLRRAIADTGAARRHTIFPRSAA